MTNRRAILKTGLAAMAGAALPRAAFAQIASPTANPSVTTLAPGVALIAGAGGNVVAASDGEAVTLADTGGAGASEVLLAAVEAAFPGQTVRTAINTHWHPDQTGANAALGRAGADIIAHANTALWMGAEVDWPYDTQWGRRADPLPAEALPGEIFYNEIGERGAGAARMRYGYMLQAHTDGDAWVFFPEANVLAAGGAVTSDRWPLIDWWTGGWFGGLVEGVETLTQVANADTIIVPSDGPVMTYAELQAQAEMYAALYLHFRDNLLFKGLSPQEAADAKPTRGIYPTWGNPDPFVIRAYESLWGYYAPDV